MNIQQGVVDVGQAAQRGYTERRSQPRVAELGRAVLSNREI